MLLRATTESLKQISTLIDILAQSPSPEGVKLFRDARVGAHIRHVHDHFKALLLGQETGCVDYNQRNRNSLAESNLDACRAEQNRILTELKFAELTDRELVVISEIDCFVSQNTQLRSTTDRELLYLINHCIHHVAIIKLILQHRGVDVPDFIGMAPSTASYLRSETERETQLW